MNKQITDQEFDSRLEDKLIENSATLLTIPGLYEVVSEYFNNEILDDFEAENIDEE